jgi:circadian clock protein KaiB
MKTPRQRIDSVPSGITSEVEDALSPRAGRTRELRGETALAAGKAPARTRALDQWNLRLYVAGTTPKSLAAITNLRRFCEEHLAGRYTIEVVDLLENPKLARGDQIIAIPTLVRKLPTPMRKVIGDLSDRERVLVGFDLRPQ